MRNSVSHLPSSRREQVLSITDIILETLRPEKIILFGSFARGNYVEHRYTGKNGILYEYISDYDFLVIVPQLLEKEYITEEKLREKTEYMRQPVNIIVHDKAFINESLAEGGYFFSEIVKEGILVYDDSGEPLASAKPLTEEEKSERNKSYFNRWLARFREYRIDSQNAFDRGSFNNSNFLLHQAAETLYYTMLLVHTGYKPKTHHLYKLRQQAKNLSEQLYLHFNLRHSAEDRRIFELLKQGYIEARYDDEYHISGADLATLMKKVDGMETIVTESCMVLTKQLVND
jgi:HEPN domain-containing protein/predicted nucleotidyltransferase